MASPPLRKYGAEIPLLLMAIQSINLASNFFLPLNLISGEADLGSWE